jgi:hypothetical protein
MGRLWLAVALGAMLALALGSPVAAASVLKQSGSIGDHGTRPPDEGPEALCGFKQDPASLGSWYLRSITVYPVLAGPAGGLDQQQIRWRVAIQRSTDGGTTWKTVRRSSAQTATADNVNPPSYTAIKQSVNGQDGQLFRAVSTLKWLTNGTATGVLKLWMETYGAKFGPYPSAVQYTNFCAGHFLE